MTDLGEKVTFTWALRRESRREEVTINGRRRTVTVRRWETGEIPNTKPPASREGVVVGVRTLCNGYVQYEYDYGNMFSPFEDGYFTAYLIAWNLRQQPVYVLPEHTSSPLVLPDRKRIFRAIAQYGEGERASYIRRSFLTRASRDRWARQRKEGYPERVGPFDFTESGSAAIPPATRVVLSETPLVGFTETGTI